MDSIVEQLIPTRSRFANNWSSSSSNNDDSSSDDEVGRGRRGRRRRSRLSFKLRKIGASRSPPYGPQPAAVTEPVDDAAVDVGGEREEEEDGDFIYGKEPEITFKHEGTKEKAKRTILDLYNELNATSVYTELTKEEEQKPTCWDQLCRMHPRKPNEAKLTPLLKVANSQGATMLRKMLLPSMPLLLQDLWVYLELLITLLAFLFGVSTFQAGTGNQSILRIMILVLAVLGIILSVIDCFIYTVYIGTIVKFICRRLKSRQQGQNHERNTQQDGERGENHEGQRKQCRCFPQLPEKWLARLNQFFGIGRTIVSELFIYPVLVCDLIELIALGEAAPETAIDRAGLGLFLAEGFYLILAVYVMRIVTIVGTIVSMLRIPLQAAGGQKQYIKIMARFCFHTLRQIFVHLLVIVAVAAKIFNENPIILEEEEPIVIGPFLWCAIVFGWIIPLAGVLTFFVVNYYWTKEFSISFWVDMMSLLQGQNFAVAVFGGEGMSAVQQIAEHVAEEVETVLVVSPEAKQKTLDVDFVDTKQKTLDFVEKSHFNEVKKQMKRFKSPSFLAKFIPFRDVVTPIRLQKLYTSCSIADVQTHRYTVTIMAFS